MQEGTAGYHGYWILDFTAVDPHLGTEAEFREFVKQAHARGLRVYLDIVANHTADVIHYKDGTTTYIDMEKAPYRDADGKPFDPHLVAFNGLGTGANFPQLSAERSFAHVPVVAPEEAHAKGPEWLNDVTLYHQPRRNSSFTGENSLHGDFVGLDDLFTESPAVVRGFIKVYGDWMERFGIDGFRIDTVKHVNLEFWEGFAPAIREKARELGRPDFFQFGEVADHTGDAGLRSEFSTTGNLDATPRLPRFLRRRPRLCLQGARCGGSWRKSSRRTAGTRATVATPRRRRRLSATMTTGGSAISSRRSKS